MADAIDFQLRLIDMMSAPARKMQQSVQGLERQLKATGKTTSVFENRKRQEALKPMPIKAVGAASPESASKAKAAQDKAAARDLAKQRSTDEKRLALAMRAEDKREKMLMASQAKAFALAERYRKQQDAAQAKAKRDAERTARDRLKDLQDAAEVSGLQGLERAFLSLEKGLQVIKTPMGMAAIGIGAVAAAAIAATVVVVAFTAGLVALGVAGAKLALSAAGARKDLEITLEAMLGSQEAAARTVDGINKITNEVAITSEKASSLVKSLSAAGLKNESVLLGTVKAIGQAESVVEGAGAKLEAIIQRSQTPKAWLTPMGVQLRKVFQISPEDLQGTGIGIQAFYDELGARIGKGTAETRFALAFGRISAEEGTKALNAVVEKKLGAAAAKKMLQLDNQLIRFRQNVKKLFEGVKVEGFLKVIKAALDIFDQSTISGLALKTMLEGTFNGLFTAVERVAPYVKIFMKGLIILALQAYIGFKPLLRAVGLVGTDGASGQQLLIERMSQLGRVVNVVATGITKVVLGLQSVGAIGPIIGAIGNMFVSMMGPIAASIAFIGKWGLAVMETGLRLLGAIPEWTKAGGDLVRGLVAGVVAAGTQLVNAVTELGDKALKAFKAKFQIASPSRVTMGFGANISMGLAQGIKSKANVANDTMAKVIPIAPFLRRPQAAYPPPRAVSPAAQGGGPGGRGGRSTGGVTLHVEKDGIHIHLEGATTAEEVRSMFPEMMADALERFAETQGVDKETNGAAA